VIKYQIQGKQRGQAIVIIALTLLVLVSLVALAVDGGNAYAQRRNAQNAVDGAAVAGITELNRIFLMNRHVVPNTSPPQMSVYPISTPQNAQIRAAILAALTAASTNSNTIDVRAIDALTNPGNMDLRYIDTAGHVYGSRITEANVQVPFAGGDGAGASGAAGIWVSTTSSAGTYFARIIGVDTVTSDAHAGARIGGAFGIHPIPQLANAGGPDGIPNLWPITVFMTPTVNLDPNLTVTLHSDVNTTAPSNWAWADLKFTADPTTNGTPCSTNSVKDFYCFLQRGYGPSTVTPFQGFEELQDLTHNPGPALQGARQLNVPVGSDGIQSGGHTSTGVWIEGTNRIQMNIPLNRLALQRAVSPTNHMNWFLPISNRVVVQNNRTYYHIVDVAAFNPSQQHCCGNPNDIVGNFFGYGWPSGYATYSNDLHRAVIDGQTVIQLGP